MAGSNRLLFIEDDKEISAMYARTLERAGWHVDFAYDGATGLQKARKEAYDLILLDIMMPELTGMEVLHELRQDGGASAQAKIIILTNLAQDATSKEAALAQADGYIIKADVVPSQLAQILQSKLEG